jgi:hypothetical protein
MEYRFEVLKMVTKKIIVSWDATRCSLVSNSSRFKMSSNWRQHIVPKGRETIRQTVQNIIIFISMKLNVTRSLVRKPC